MRMGGSRQDFSLKGGRGRKKAIRSENLIIALENLLLYFLS